MRHRSTILFLLGCILAIAPVLRSNAAQAACAQRSGGGTDEDLFSGLFGGDATACTLTLPPPPIWVRGMTFLAVFCFGASALTGALAWRDRRRESELLRDAGFRVRERDLPLE